MRVVEVPRYGRIETDPFDEAEGDFPIPFYNEYNPDNDGEWPGKSNDIYFLSCRTLIVFYQGMDRKAAIYAIKLLAGCITTESREERTAKIVKLM